jgi:hypothetical protein
VIGRTRVASNPVSSHDPDLLGQLEVAELDQVEAVGADQHADGDEHHQRRQPYLLGQQGQGQPTQNKYARKQDEAGVDHSRDCDCFSAIPGVRPVKAIYLSRAPRLLCSER